MIDKTETNLATSLAELTATHTHTTIETLLRRWALRYGLRSIAYLGFGFVNSVEPFLAVTYSADWVEHYKQQRYLEIDPVIRVGMGRLLPLDWEEFGRHEGRIQMFFGEACEFGLGRRGLTIPVHGRGGDRALFTITADLSHKQWIAKKLAFMRDFQLLAVHLHDKVLELEGRPIPRSQLSPRELECLQWTAEGKTAWECSVILGLSEHTVRCYLESARHKLNASSNTHAISIAYRSGVLFPPL